MIHSFLKLEKLISILTIIAGLGMIALAFGISLVGIGEGGFGTAQLQIASAGLVLLLSGFALLIPPAQRYLHELFNDRLPSTSIASRIARLFAILAWIGLIVVLAEAIGFLALQQLPYFSLGMWAVLAIGISLLIPPVRQLFRRLVSYEETSQSPLAQAAMLLGISLWFGLVAGFVDGIGNLILQRFVYREVLLVWTQIVWIAPFVNSIIFGLIGLVLCGIALLSRHLKAALPLTTIAIFVFSFLTLYEWLWKGLFERIHEYAMLFLALGLAFTLTRWFIRRHAITLRIFRISLPVIAALAVIAFAGIQGGTWIKERMDMARLPQAPADSPNVLVIVADTLRADHLSTYGYQRPTSPNIDRLAEEGTLFETAFSSSPWSLPSHASLLTGLYSHEHQLIWTGNQPRMDKSYPTMTDYLRDRGYRTAAFSANIFWFTRVQGFGRGFIHFEDFFHSPAAMMYSTTYGSKVVHSMRQRFNIHENIKRKWAPDINSATLEWLAKNPDVPSFTFLNYFDVHDPYVPPQPYRSMFKDSPRFHSIPDNPEIKRTKEQLLQDIDQYDGAIAYMDEHIGNLLAEIHEMGLDENLIVVFTSDHGEAFGEHGERGHQHSVYREEIHVPLIFWSPGKIPGGLRVSQPVSNVSLAATVVDMLEGNGNAPLPGDSLARLWQNANGYPDWPAPLAEMEHQPWMTHDGPSRYGSMRSLVSPGWHYIEHDTLGSALYDWDDDPYESNNMADSSEGQTAIQHIKNTLGGILARE